MDKLQIDLMLKRAEDILEDANYLKHWWDKKSDSHYLLSLLAFEILLKCLLRIDLGKQIKGHDYKKLFNKLPVNVQEMLVELAKERMAPLADFSNLEKLLNVWFRNFIKLRYPYEEYEGLLEPEYIELGETWVREGSKIENAKFVYYPNELKGLIFALKHVINARTESQ